MKLQARDRLIVVTLCLLGGAGFALTLEDSSDLARVVAGIGFTVLMIVTAVRKMIVHRPPRGERGARPEPGEESGKDPAEPERPR